MNYFVPANSKKSLLILGLFNKSDLAIIGMGSGLTLMIILFLPMSSIFAVLLGLLPVLITAALVFPLPSYHNIFQFLVNTANFFITQFSGGHRYYWKGWCIWDDAAAAERENNKFK